MVCFTIYSVVFDNANFLFAVLVQNSVFLHVSEVLLLTRLSNDQSRVSRGSKILQSRAEFVSDLRNLKIQSEASVELRVYSKTETCHKKVNRQISQLDLKFLWPPDITQETFYPWQDGNSFNFFFLFLFCH